jgi:hypothetical protein
MKRNRKSIVTSSVPLIVLVILGAGTQCRLLPAEQVSESRTAAGEVHNQLPNNIEAENLNTFPGLELFLDDHLISSTQNVVRAIKTPLNHADNPILRAQYPWEERYMTLYGTVMHDPTRGKFRMWYNAFGSDYRKQSYLAYAESDDGFHWRKPMMNILPFGDRAKTNLLLGRDTNVHGPAILLNPIAPPAERYLAIWDSYTHNRPDSPESRLEGRAVYSATSPDGIHFSPANGKMIVLGKSDVGQSAVWNSDRGKIQLYMRGVNEYKEEGGPPQRVRYVRYAESPDGRTWSEPIELMRADEIDGAPDNQIHQLTVTRYGNVYVGLLTMFHVDRLEFGGRHLGEKMDRLEHGVTDTQLAFSRDGINWNRVADRTTFLPRGSPGEWNGGWIVTSSDLVVHNDEVRIYYAGFPERYSVGQTAIGVATLPLDRFIAMKPKRLNKEGILELKPYWYPGGDVLLNADASKGGRIEAEVLSFDGTVIEGFDRTAFSPIRGDDLRHTLRWATSGGQKSLTDAAAPNGTRAVRLRFYLHNAEIYSLRYVSYRFGAK